MGTQSLRLKVGSIYTKGPGKIYYFRYQVEGAFRKICLRLICRIPTNTCDILEKRDTSDIV